MNIAPVTAPAAMSVDDVALLRRAEELLGRVWTPGRHEVATALRTADGGIHLGVHMEGSCRRSSICAEGMALGAALIAGPPTRVQTVVSVQVKPADRFRVIAPCGVCRELISDYSPGAQVWLTSPASDEIVALRALDLLPEKSDRIW
jgi:cytidine deaminase